MPLPNFIIVGETKCGTSSLYEDLVQHPDILPSFGNGDQPDYTGGAVTLAQKEIRFFDRYWARGIDWYKSCFAEAKNKITGEASPTYLYRTLAMKRIHDTSPDTKIIIMLRNPIHRAYSHFHHIMGIAPKWGSRYPTFDTFLDSAQENDYYIIGKGIYVESVKRCYELFSNNQVCIIRSEDLFNKPIQAYNNILRFLNIPAFTPKQFSHLRNSNFKQPMTREAYSVLSNLYAPYNQELYDYIQTDMNWK